MSENKRIKTQVRFPKYLWDFITEEAERSGMAKNAVLIRIVDDSMKKAKRK